MDSASRSRRRRLLILLGVAALTGGVALAAWWFWPEKLPPRGSPLYEEYVEAFEVGTAELDAGRNDRADVELSKAIRLVPGEPAAWANRGLMYLRIGAELEKAESDLRRAAKLAPGNPDIEEMLSLLMENRGKIGLAIRHIEAALGKTPEDTRRLYRLAALRERDGKPDTQWLETYDQILKIRPTSLPVLGGRLSVAVRVGDEAALADTLKRLDALAPGWKAETREGYEALKKAIAEKKGKEDLQLAANQFANMLKPEPGYVRSSSQLSPPPDFVGSSLQQFIRLEPLRTTPDEPDLELTFEPREKCSSLEGLKGGGWDALLPFWGSGEAGAIVLGANGKEVAAGGEGKFSAPLGPATRDGAKPTADSVLPIDWDNDERTDLVLASPRGLAFLHQDGKGGFADVSSKTGLGDSLLKGEYHGAWAADIDMDGDLDVVLAPRAGTPMLLRNNFNGTFTLLPVFPGVDSPRAFVWADLDNDGAPDAALLDREGKLHVFLNERAAQFKRVDVSGGRFIALAVADVSDSGRFDLIAAAADGRLLRLSNPGEGQAWKADELGKAGIDLPKVPGDVRLQAIDLDSNGAIDLVLRTPSGGVAWLADGKGGFARLAAKVPPGVADIFCLEDGSLEVLAIEKGKPACHAVKQAKPYKSSPFRLRASPKESGDNRINSFAIGSEFEVRAGTLVVKQPVRFPTFPVGLGRRKKISVARSLWTNGAAQFEFDTGESPPEVPRPLLAGNLIKIRQRVKGSCPFLFTWDGTKMVFVTDVCWSTPLGLYINAQKKDPVVQTTEWFLVRGDQLAPRGGVYDVRVNANLWETHYLDLLQLMVVDHPPDTELYVDERFFLTPTPLRLYLTTPSRPVAKAYDHNGKDVTDVVRERDGKYLASAGLGLYQGLTRDHWVEVDTGDVPGEGPLYLLAHGWLQPTDSSLNVAIEQRNADRPTPLTLEVPDGKGGWKQAGPPLGFPVGKNKTMVIRLDGPPPGAPAGATSEEEGAPAGATSDKNRRVRLRTNMEVYWDSLRVARGLDEKQCVTKTLAAKTADLRFRGVVRMTRADRFSPEIPHYDQVINRGQYWRDLIGYHTRFGDVKELVEKVDDRYVLMNAGDELRMTFDAPAVPKDGWRRDFVWVCDGWTKDGDLNTRFGKTVLPLPSHGMKGYDTPPGRLQDDPVYRRHRKDWEVYHTRYVTPAVFEMGLRAYRLGR